MPFSRALVRATVFAPLCLIPVLSLATNSFTLLPLPSGGVSSNAAAISRDGTVVVGGYHTATAEWPYRWYLAHGVGTIPKLHANASYQYAVAVSNGGTLIAGGEVDTGSPFTKGFVWNGTTQPFACLSTLHPSSYPAAISNDGSTVAGWSNLDSGATHAVRWTAATSMLDLGVYSGDYNSEAAGISGDGKVVVGYSNGTSYHAVKWLADNSIHLLPKHANDAYSQAYAANIDGSIIVGLTGSDVGNNGACVWTGAGVKYLPLPSGYNYVYNASTSDDGKVILVNAQAGITLLWTPQSGLISLHDYLNSLGLSVPGFWVAYCSVSADGTAIAGSAFVNNVERGFYARITPPPALKQVTLAPNPVLDTAASTGTVYLTSVALQDTTVTLASGNTSVLTVPASVKILKGSDHATFSAVAHTLTATKVVHIVAGLNADSINAYLTVNP